MDNSPYLNRIRDLKVLRDLLNEHEATLKARAAHEGIGRGESVSVSEEKALLAGKKPAIKQAS